MKFKLFCLLTILLGGLIPPAHAQTPIDSLRGVVQGYLNQQLGREAILLEYTFQETTWQDSSLGCPLPDQSYDQAEISGFQWFLLMDDGIRYALHSDTTAEQIVLCAATSEITFAYSRYTNDLFTIDHPNLWSPQAIDANSFRFSLRGAAACNLPSLVVVAAVETLDANTLLSDYLSDNNLTFEGDFAPYADSGRSATVTLSDCGDRTQRITALTTPTGTGYLLVQTALTSVFEIWRAPFDAIRDSFVIGSNAPLEPSVEGIAAPTPIADVPAVPEAPALDLSQIPLAHVFVGDLFIGRINRLPGVPLTFTGNNTPRNLVTSADGQQLAYTANGQLLTINAVQPISPNRLTEPDTVYANFPPAWSPQGASLAYVVRGEDAQTITIQAINPDGSTNVLATLPFDDTLESCQAESGYAVDQLYWAETGINGNGMTFAWLPNDRFVYSTACDGFGLALYDITTSESTLIAPDLRRAALAPDQNQLAAIGDQRLVWVDLSTLRQSDLATSQPPDQVGWDATSTQIYYSTNVPNEVLLWQDESTEQAAIEALGVFPFESRLSNLSVYQFDVQSGLEVLLWNGTGFAIGQLIGIPDGSGVLFTLIPSDRDLLTSFANDAERPMLRNSIPETELYALTVDFENPEQQINAQLIAVSSQPVFAVPR